jgi:hypothetical protein
MIAQIAGIVGSKIATDYSVGLGGLYTDGNSLSPSTLVRRL